MKTPNIQTRQAVIRCAATAAQTLPEQAVAIRRAFYLNQNATAGVPLPGVSLTPVAAAPGATEIQFTGTGAAPSTALTLNAVATVGVLLIVEYVPVGAVPAAA